MYFRLPRLTATVLAKKNNTKHSNNNNNNNSSNSNRNSNNNNNNNNNNHNHNNNHNDNENDNDKSHRETKHEYGQQMSVHKCQHALPPAPLQLFYILRLPPLPCRGSRGIVFFDPPWCRGFHLPSQVRDDFVHAIFFDILYIVPNIFLIPSQYIFLMLLYNTFLMRHPKQPTRLDWG